MSSAVNAVFVAAKMTPLQIPDVGPGQELVGRRFQFFATLIDAQEKSDSFLAS